MENSRRCENSKVDFHRASMPKQLRKKKLLENGKQNEIIIQEWLFGEEQAPIKNIIKNFYNPKTLKQIAGENIKLNDKELEKDLGKKMINPQ